MPPFVLTFTTFLDLNFNVQFLKKLEAINTDFYIYCKGTSLTSQKQIDRFDLKQFKLGQIILSEIQIYFNIHLRKTWIQNEIM